MLCDNNKQIEHAQRIILSVTTNPNIFQNRKAEMASGEQKNVKILFNFFCPMVIFS